MKIIPERYECEVCRTQYNQVIDAQDCEARGTGPDYPVGLIFGDHSKDSMYSNITFAIAENVHFHHQNESAKWACRDNGAGDSLGEQRCGNGNGVHLNEYDALLDFEHPTFKRMVSYLQENNIPISIWNGDKPISLEEALKSKGVVK